MRTAFFIDGYNLFYGLLANTPYKWLDLPALLTHITTIENPKSKTAKIYYFSSPVKPELASRGTQSKEAQDSYIRALKACGVSVTMGRHTLEPAQAPRFVNKSTRPSRQDKVDIWKLEEKETDVNLAVSLYRLLSKQQALHTEDQIQQVVLVSTNTDIDPIEVKSSKCTRAKSLASYIDKCAPSKTFKLTGTQGSSALEQTNIVMPVYFTQYLPQK